jgi:hypothetical protein
LTNTSSVINKSLLYNESVKFPLFSVDLEKLYREYFSCEFVDFTIEKLGKMFIDFKIIIRLVDSFIKAFKERVGDKSDKSPVKTNNMRKIHSEDANSINLLNL